MACPLIVALSLPKRWFRTHRNSTGLLPLCCPCLSNTPPSKECACPRVLGCHTDAPPLTDGFPGTVPGDRSQRDQNERPTSEWRRLGSSKQPQRADIARKAENAWLCPLDERDGLSEPRTGRRPCVNTSAKGGQPSWKKSPCGRCAFDQTRRLTAD